MDEADLDRSLAQWTDHRTGQRTSGWVAAGGPVCSRPGAEPDVQLYGVASPRRDDARFPHCGSGFSRFATPQRPESRGAINLRSTDPPDRPAIDPRYVASDPSGRDLATLVEGVTVNHAIAAAPTLADVIAHELGPSAECRTDEEIVRHVRVHGSSLHHPSSTCRMGQDTNAVSIPAVSPRTASGTVKSPTRRWSPR